MHFLYLKPYFWFDINDKCWQVLAYLFIWHTFTGWAIWCALFYLFFYDMMVCQQMLVISFMCDGVLFGFNIYVANFTFFKNVGSSFAFPIHKTYLIQLANVDKFNHVFCLYVLGHFIFLFISFFMTWCCVGKCIYVFFFTYWMDLLVCLFYLFSYVLMVCGKWWQMNLCVLPLYNGVLFSNNN